MELIKLLEASRTEGPVIRYLTKELGTQLYKVPGVENFRNSSGKGFGIRYVMGSTAKCIRFNWDSEGSVGRFSDLSSIDVFLGTGRDPDYSITLDNTSLVKVLPQVADAIAEPRTGSKLVFPSDVAESVFEDTSDQPEKVVTAVVKDLVSGATLSREDFIKHFGAANAGIFDAMVKAQGGKEELVPTDDGKTLEKDTLDQAATITTKKGGSGETYAETDAEAAIDGKPTYAETLEHLDGLVSAVVSGAGNALFIAGRGGCLSSDCTIRVNEEGEERIISMGDLADRISSLIGYMEPDQAYSLMDNQIQLMIETPTGWSRLKSFVRKVRRACLVTIDSTSTIKCSVDHLFITPAGPSRADTLQPGQTVCVRSGTAFVESVTVLDEVESFYDVEVDDDEHVFYTADGLLHHNTGKTQTVENALHDHGLADGHGYFKITGTASASGIYGLLYKHRNDIILFDDADGALADQDSRNLIKAATDTKKHRQLVWGKRSFNVYDPDSADAEKYAHDPDMAPNKFTFSGKIIFITNLSIEKLDPDGALRTRAFIIDVNPNNQELLDFMHSILHDIRIEDGLTLSDEEREEVFNLVKRTSKGKDLSIRKLVRALNLAASGAPNWEKLVSLYS
jgi:hypothetical protein